ncbi:uncharacterized protein FIBRA_08725 [Fibroporia radiculosa]|uniref:F-box domain-containing protein n=1 Tax=Fibroporia radiculosa TaxID=599839 RepID=J4GXB4_9APHY|nr:uncharacterized protein FIBRA_08725 [Fibroporia radiculosa]CCM06460.1 predicted protein [Fibroporia radiculosa]
MDLIDLSQLEVRPKCLVAPSDDFQCHAQIPYSNEYPLYDLFGTKYDPFIEPPQLPTELLVHIFLLCKDNDGESVIKSAGYSSAWTPDRVEVRISHVCRRWRSIALDIPALWTEIYFLKADPWDMVDAYLARSKNTTIDVSIDFDAIKRHQRWHRGLKWSKRAYLRCLRALLDRIGLHRKRWRSFRFTTSNLKYFVSFCEHFRGAGGAEFRHAFYRGPNHASSLTYTDSGIKEVLLQDVQMNWTHDISMFRDLVQLSLADLSSVTCPTFRELADTLKTSARLQTLELVNTGPLGDPRYLPDLPEHFPYAPDSHQGSEALLVSHSLQELTLASSKPQFLSQLFHHAVFPNLKKLSIWLTGDCTDIILALSQLSYIVDEPLVAGLTHLQLGRMRGGNAADIGDLCETMPNVTTLTLDFHGVCRWWYYFLVAGGDPRTLRCVHTLDVTGLTAPEVRYLVASRNAWGMPRLDLTVHSPADMETDDVRWLRKHTDNFTFVQTMDVDNFGMSAMRRKMKELRRR